MLAAAVAALRDEGLAVVAMAPLIASRPLGPSRRSYANGAAIVDCALEPAALLALLKRIEVRFGQRRGQRWRARVLDLDIVLWSGGAFGDALLMIPHPAFRQRNFVLTPARTIAARWRDPIGGLTLQQLHARLTRPRPRPR